MRLRPHRGNRVVKDFLRFNLRVVSGPWCVSATTSPNGSTTSAPVTGSQTGGDSSRRPRPSTPPHSTCSPEAGTSSSPPPLTPSSVKAIYALALEIIQPGLLRHPASITLAGLRGTALHRLMEHYQQFDPFKFLIYAELAGAEIGPVE